MNDYVKYRDEDLLILLHEPKPSCDYAFSEIFRRHANKLYAFCKYKLENSSQSDDLFQETWYSFIKEVKKRTPITNIEPYLIKIAYKKLIAYIKQNDKENSIFISKKGIELDSFSEPMNFIKNLENNELLSFIMIGIQNLDDIYRETYILKNLNELSINDIADITEETPDCIQKRLERATKMLKEFINQYAEELKK